jgi:hypothetical protein
MAAAGCASGAKLPSKGQGAHPCQQLERWKANLNEKMKNEIYRIKNYQKL